MNEHSNIIYTDVDTIWLQDPRPYFNGNFDIFAQLDGIIDGVPYFEGYLPYFCSGFVAFRKTENAADLLQKWISDRKHENFEADQVSFNKVVQMLKVRAKPLPMTKFSCGMIYFDQMSQCMKNNAVMVHNNYISGIRNKIKVSISLLSSQGNLKLHF